jgi:hypothetical protein
MKICARCGKEISIARRVSREQTCPHCGAWLHSCVNCKFYSPGRHNDCMESEAELVRDKESSNFCEFFVFKDTRTGDSGTKGPRIDEEQKKQARDAFDKLFGDS